MHLTVRDFRFWETALPRGGAVGVALDGPRFGARALMVDADGVLWVMAIGDRPELVRWALSLELRVYPELGLLLKALAEGGCLGLLPRLAPRLGVPVVGRRWSPVLLPA